MQNKISTTIIYKNLPPTGNIFYNYKPTSTETFTENPTSTYKCICNNPLLQQYTNHHNHINTNNTDILNTLEIINNQQPTNINKLANMGAGFILKPTLTTQYIKNTITINIIKFIEQLADKYNLPLFIFNTWKEYIISKINILTHNIPTNTHTPDFNITNIKKSLKKIHEHITISPTDKMKNNYRFTCTAYYKRTLYQKITNNEVLLNRNNNITEKATPPAYTATTLHNDNINTQHQQFLHQYNINMPSTKLPYIYMIYKAHKNNSRGVTAAYNVTTTNLAKILHHALLLIIKQLQTADNTFQLNTNYNRHWRINTANDVHYLLHKLNQQPNPPECLQAFDIEGFYDNIDIKKMIKIINHIIPQAYSISNKKYIKIEMHKQSATWTNYKYTKHNNNTYYFTATDICTLQAWHLDNAYITYNNTIWKQTKGIAQGTNQSPDLADLILMYYEQKFINYHSSHNPEIAKKFSNTTRKMDDVLFINNHNAINHIYKNNNNKHGIYPQKYFKLTSDAPPNTTVNYLDMNIHITNTLKYLQPKIRKIDNFNLMQLRKVAKRINITQHGNKHTLLFNIKQKLNNNTPSITKTKIFNSRTYNKTDNFPINAINFPHIHSHTPHNIIIGSIIGRLHSYTITNMYSLHDFINTTKKLYHKLQTQNNYPTQILDIATKKFITKHKPYYGIPPTSLLTLIKEKCMGSAI